MKKLLLLPFILVGLETFSQCTGTQSSTVNPLPVGGFYNAGQVVDFCYTMQNYNQVGINWVHTFDIDFGVGWDPASLTVTSVPNSCDGQGFWDYYPSVTSSNTGTTYFNTISYESPSGNPLFIIDGNPGNNFGDNCTNFSWTFCFSLQVSPSCNNQSLEVKVKAIGDGNAGIWGNTSCPGAWYQLVNATCLSCQLTINTTVTQPSCANNDGEIDITAVNGGTAPYTYTWSNGNVTATNSNLSSGTYYVTVEDNVGCMVIDTFTINFINPVTFTSSFTNLTCFNSCDGDASVNVLTGTAPFTYQWSNGATTSAITNICAGTYYVTITDVNLCTQLDTFTITEPPDIVLAMSHTDANCYLSQDGSATVVAAGGVGGFTYLWNPSNQTTATASNVSAGNYSVTVTDASGCTEVGTVVIAQPAQLAVIPTTANATCYGFSDGSISVIVNAGTPPYSYLWTPGGQTTSAINGLAKGWYYLAVTDANNCVRVDSYFIDHPDSLTGTFAMEPASCSYASDGSLTITPLGGTAPFDYLWSHDASLNNATADNLAPGNYSVIVTDANGCGFTMDDDVTFNPNFIVSLPYDTSIELGNVVYIPVSTDQNGTYNYLWNPGYNLDDSTSGNPAANPYYQTTYVVLVTDIYSGCFDYDTITITILPTSYVLVPNAFTPNADGLNDVFLPVLGDLAVLADFKVFNRWGQIVYNNPNDGWDGKNGGIDEEVGTYIYTITYIVKGRTDVYHLKGSVTLLR